MAAGSRQRMEHGHTKVVSRKWLSVYIYLHLVDLYGKSMDAMCTVLPKKQLYTKKTS